jgi:hypothetical protein
VSVVAERDRDLAAPAVLSDAWRFLQDAQECDPLGRAE